MGQGYVLVSHSGTHLFHRIEATQSKARRQIVSDMTPEEMKKELERLQAENETLKKRSEKELSLKVSQKGGVSVYGLGRFPVTLYKEQWEKLLEMTDDIRAFIQENKAPAQDQGFVTRFLETVGMCPEVRGKRTAPSTRSSGYQIRRQPPRVREPRSD